MAAADKSFGSKPDLARSDTLRIDAISELQGGSHDLHVFSAGWDVYAMPRRHIPKYGLPANVVYQAITDLRQLDHNPRLNMASFVTTWMEPQANELIKESLNVNLVDLDEYPSCTDIQNRCVAMLADLFHSPAAETAPTGTASIGSSEAIMLAGLAMKKKWMARRKAAGLPYDKPNLVMSYTVQVCWEKFCRYFDVEEKFVPVEEGRYCISADLAKALIDENTIGVVGILGSTYTGEFEDIVALNDMVDQVRAEKGWEVPVHVDGASGGFIAPFQYPDLLWDFRLPNVKSINVSGHKYGLVYAGVGWVLWREPSDLPDDLVFHVNYLGTDQATVTLNFSRGASHVIAQYYQLLRLGRDGYSKVMGNLADIAGRLKEGILETGHFEILSQDVGVPLVAFRLLPRKMEDGEVVPHGYDEFDVSDRLKEDGWVLPAYTMAPNAGHVKLLRAVVRLDHSMTLVDKLIESIHNAVKVLDTQDAVMQEKLKEIRRAYQPARAPDNPHRVIKMQGQC